jgi:hypothetical protein
MGCWSELTSSFTRKAESVAPSKKFNFFEPMPLKDVPFSKNKFFSTRADDTRLKVRWEPVTSLRSEISSPEFSRHSAIRLSDSLERGGFRKAVLFPPTAEATAF